MSARIQTWSPKVQLDLTKPYRFTDRLKEIDLFFQKRDPVHVTMRRLAKQLEKAGIPYALAGGMAVNAHNYVRTTGDVGILLAPDGFEQFKTRFVPKHYDSIPDRARRFMDRKNNVKVDFLLTGRYPGSGKPGPIAFPDPNAVRESINDVQVIDLVTLVQLKLAARRHRDFGEVVELIRFNHLDETFAERLHESVPKDYIECLDEKRREDEYEARNG